VGRGERRGRYRLSAGDCITNLKGGRRRSLFGCCCGSGSGSVENGKEQGWRGKNNELRPITVDKSGVIHQ